MLWSGALSWVLNDQIRFENPKKERKKDVDHELKKQRKNDVKDEGCGRDKSEKKAFPGSKNGA